MKKLYFLAALVGVWGCRAVQQESGVPITFTPTEQTPSRSNVLVAGDIVGVFAAVEGTENYFLENAKYVVGSDGRSLSTSPAVYYPEAKQAVVFTAYLPLGGTWSGTVGTFSVPADQSTTLKQADLCWAKASSTPVATAVPLEFNHKMARLLITTNEQTTKIAIPNAFSGGTLDIRTGTFTNTLKSSVSTSGAELILPAQTVTRLVLTVAGVEYVFEGAISLESAKTTTVNLTLNPSTKTATLSGSSTTINWTTSASSDTPAQSVSNVLTLHWPNYFPQGATPNKVTFTINNVEHTISSGITYADQTFTVPFTATTLRYPYTIAKIAFYRGTSALFPTCTNLFGATIYKSTASTIGIKDHANAILINGLWWATGNLVADGPNDCKIGLYTDAGLHFPFGSLIGWGGGASGSGKGQGTPSKTMTVNPSNYSGTTAWPGGYYSSPPSGTGYCYPATDNPESGVGDPCRYYLGAIWHTPTNKEWVSMPATYPGVVAPYADYGFTYVNAASPQYAFRILTPDFRIAATATSFSDGIVNPYASLAVSSRTANDYGYYVTLPPSVFYICRANESTAMPLHNQTRVVRCVSNGV